MLTRIQKAVDYIKSQSNNQPKLACVLGSGLGEYAEKFSEKIEIPYDQIPGFHKTTVAGHAGKLVIGKVHRSYVVAMQGRYHAYEGHNLNEVVFPIRVLAKLGLNKIILTNASGGINSGYTPGDLVLIQDHLNFTGNNPLIGKNIDELGTRFPDMTNAYAPKLREQIKSAAKEMGMTIKEGIYAGVLGPSYETPAEIKMLKVLGADLVGMSTVYETIVANHMGLQVAGISCVTNMASGMGHEKLTHEDVKEVANIAKEKFTKLLDLSIKEILK